MNLDKELRTVLATRAEEGTAPALDIEAVRAGGLARRRRSRVTAAVQGLVLLAVLAGGVAWGQDRLDGRGNDPGPVREPASSFVGRWTSTDVDGSSQTMTIRVNSAGRYSMVLHDTFTGPCVGPSTDAGTGRVWDGELLISGVTTACANGRKPDAAAGSMNFVHRSGSNTIRDSSRVVWSRQ